MDTQNNLPKATAAGRPEELNCNIAIFGDHGGGKTAWTEEILLANKKRLIIFDTLRKDYGNEEFCKATGIHYDAVLTEHGQFVAKIKELSARGTFRIVDRSPREFQLKHMELFRFDETEKRSALTDVTWAVEEINQYMTSGTCEPILLDHLTNGRHSTNNLVGIARMPKEVDTLFRGQANITISFRQHQKRALDYFRDYDPDLAEELKDLQIGEFRIFDGTVQQLKDFIAKP